jgi:DNA gyrase/topoisomerase IV subunit B
MKEEEIKIKYLKWPESVRQRSGMYAGSLENPNVLLREICDNSQDELAQGYGDTIIVSNDFNGYLFVSDNARGMPITMADGEFSNITQTKLSVTTIHSGSKFGASGDSSRVGMNGCAQAVVNALSERFIIMSRITQNNYNRSIPEVEQLWNSCGPRSKRDLFYVLVYEKGIQKFEGACKLKDIEKSLFGNLESYQPIPEGQSTIVMFKADSELYENTKAAVSYENLQYFLLIQEKFYKRKVNIVVNNELLQGQFKPYKYEILETITPKDTSANPNIGVYLTFEIDENNLNSKDVFGSINGLPSAGLHLTIAENCFKTALKDFYKIKRDNVLTNGLKMCIIVLAQEVLFSSQTKENLKGITKVKTTDFAPLVRDLEKIFKKNPDYWEGYVNKLQAIADSLRDIGAAEKAQRMIDNAANVNSMYRNKQNLVPGFVDATGTDRWNCELLISEGLSPQTSLKNARKADDVKHIGLLALRGKVLDVSGGMTASKMLTNAEFYTMFSVLGLGIDQHSVIKDAKSPEEAFEIIKKKTRYGKLVIATDSDEDGLAIQKGILFCISKFAKFMINYGLTFIAESPIFEQGGKYYYPSDPRIPGSQFCVGMDPSKHFRRFKGLTSSPNN